MRIRAFMPLFNESDIMPWSIRHLVQQGCEVYVIDGWSTDGGWEALERLPIVGRERLPEGGDDGIWNCTRLLTRVQRLAVESHAAWCMLNDADEFRVSPFDRTLADHIALLAGCGWNVIDHDVLSFQPVDDGWTPDQNPQQYFRYYTMDPAIDGVCHRGIPQQKIWRNDAPVDLVSSGGHVCARTHPAVAPERFILKHYPYRTNAQARRKIATRLARRCHAEHNRGWGVHYDAFAPDRNYIQDRSTLKEWEAALVR